jgi:hypothetical protein
MVSASAKMWICTDHQVDGYIPDEASSEAYFDQILKLLDLRAYCGQLELSNSGKYHFQYVLYLNTKQRLSYLKSKLPNAHFEICFNKKHSHAYCKKEDTRIHGPYEYGDFPFRVEPKTVIDWENVWLLAKRGLIESIEPRVRIQYYSVFRKIRDFEQKPSLPMAFTRGIWIHGDPGSFKSRFVMFFSDTFRIVDGKKTVLYDKKIDKWWDLFDDRINLNVCIDEVHPKCSLTFFHNLKTWSDFRPFIADVKGGSTYPSYENLFVTANYSLRDCVLSNKIGGDYINDEQLFFALRRRFIDINMTCVKGSFKHKIISVSVLVPYEHGKISLDDLDTTPEMVRFYSIIECLRRFYDFLKSKSAYFRISQCILIEVFDKNGLNFYSRVINIEKNLLRNLVKDDPFFDQECLFGINLSSEDSVIHSLSEFSDLGRTRALSELSLFNLQINDDYDAMSFHSANN